VNDAPLQPSDPPGSESHEAKYFREEATRLSLLSRIKDWEDDQSWREFFDRYWRLIHSAALKAGLSSDEAQEVVQETVLTVAKNIGEFRADPKRGHFRAWLLHTVRWRITDQFRPTANGLPSARLPTGSRCGASPHA
jgi:DNA-directed RNA polymerase specialized sigma24 family protein